MSDTNNNISSVMNINCKVVSMNVVIPSFKEAGTAIGRDEIVPKIGINQYEVLLVTIAEWGIVVMRR